MPCGGFLARLNPLALFSKQQDTDLKARLMCNDSLSDEIAADTGQWVTAR